MTNDQVRRAVVLTLAGRRPLKAAIVATRDLCRERYEEFGSAGRASGITPIPLEEMARRYAAADERRVPARRG